MFKKIKQKYDNLIKKILKKRQQRKIFYKTQIGDMLWCNMPLPKKQLKEIEESHRIRPYLVVEKGTNYVIKVHQKIKKN